jgi:hypothetical protein
MKKAFLSLVAGSSLLVSGCGVSGESLAYGSLGGAAAGAGTGAIIGTVIANGDVATSALLGGAIGIPVGIALGAIIDYHSDARVTERRTAKIQKNQAEIYDRQRELDRLRDEIRDAGPTGNPPKDLQRYEYDGNTLGNWYR